MDIRSSVQAILTSNYATDRVFYIQVDPFSILPEIPSIFYRKFKHQLKHEMFFVDLKNNVIQVMIGKGPIAAYILAKYENLVGLRS
ncbi:hypothetical protein PIB30_046252 [Stylosanthes scabra]|uniref:Uncharacterized protein n=1 Tax=Stylosanthes scabra TaxID=79078 RepID=A0ABU6WIE1_9FABA|nr:hypothetical protein [Stylosanthes scabra]